MAEEPASPTKPPSLDEIVSHSAVVIAEQIQDAAKWARSEMDLQVEVAGFLKDFARQAKINLGASQCDCRHRAPRLGLWQCDRRIQGPRHAFPQ